MSESRAAFPSTRTTTPSRVTEGSPAWERISSSTLPESSAETAVLLGHRIRRREVDDAGVPVEDHLLAALGSGKVFGQPHDGGDARGAAQDGRVGVPPAGHQGDPGQVRLHEAHELGGGEVVGDDDRGLLQLQAARVPPRSAHRWFRSRWATSRTSAARSLRYGSSRRRKASTYPRATSVTAPAPPPLRPRCGRGSCPGARGPRA